MLVFVGWFPEVDRSNDDGDVIGRHENTKGHNSLTQSRSYNVSVTEDFMKLIVHLID